MAKRRKVIGICRLCGEEKELSFEHVPPQKAFNSGLAIVMPLQPGTILGPDDPITGMEYTKGVGAYTLCHRCNNTTGSWYGNGFIRWCQQGAHLLDQSDNNPTLYYPYYIDPLSVLKQIVAMFFSVNAFTFSKDHEELVGFVLNRERRYLSPKYRIFTYYNDSNRIRRVGLAGKIDLQIGGLVPEVRNMSFLSEIAHWPFGYVLTVNSPSPNPRLFEISHFARYEYGQYAVTHLQLPLLPIHLQFPGDYRTKEEIYAQVRATGSVI